MPCAPMPHEAWPSWTVFGIRTYHVDEVLMCVPFEIKNFPELKCP